MRPRWGFLVLCLGLGAPCEAAPQPAPRPASQQPLALDAVRIEGKLYSPQALFIVARTPEHFGRDAVVPHYLQHAPALRTLPYELRPGLRPEVASPGAKPRPESAAAGR
jgi:hypothetical protein